MNWLVRKIVDGYHACARRLQARRYGAATRRLGRQPPSQPEAEPPTPRRGFIIIQIDGLAYDHLLQAIARGATPHLKQLIGLGRLRLARWRCGFPSTTPAVQAGIMFGYNWDIPGFRWYDKNERRGIVSKWPADVKATQARIAQGRPGILRGGSSYFNMFDGQAEWAAFTISSLGRFRFFEGVRGLGLTILFLLGPLRILRVIRLSLWNYVLDVGRRFLALFRPSIYRPFDWLSPMTHILTNVLFQEIQTFGVQMDIYRGAPAIYVTNTLYDEAAHQVGPTHPVAFQALKKIDRQIAQIDKTLTRYRHRAYDLYILSDHGMSPSVPFQERFGHSLGDFILQEIGQPLILDERWGEYGHAVTKARYLLDELEGLQNRSPRGQATLLQAARQYLNRQIPWDHEHSRWDLEQRGDIVVRVSGPLAHVYFNVSPERLNLSEVALLYPTLLYSLITHEGIGAVVGREGTKTTAIAGALGVLTVRQGKIQLQGSHPLKGLQDPRRQALQIDHLASFPHSGDLILLGAWEQNGRVVTFEDQIGTHGGLGGPQEEPFILYPTDLEWSASEINNARDLYPLFARYTAEQPDSG